MARKAVNFTSPRTADRSIMTAFDPVSWVAYVNGMALPRAIPQRIYKSALQSRKRRGNSIPPLLSERRLMSQLDVRNDTKQGIYCICRSLTKLVRFNCPGRGRRHSPSAAECFRFANGIASRLSLCMSLLSYPMIKGNCLSVLKGIYVLRQERRGHSNLYLNEFVTQ